MLFRYAPVTGLRFYYWKWTWGRIPFLGYYSKGRIVPNREGEGEGEGEVEGGRGRGWRRVLALGVS